ncbi:hypothetical protein ACFT2C_05100 [Promicromonospora sp. NPDC057138]|uniref:hypothetical protein n=1 Tax=Promicromonospora sp. NPDC057138 TaxID=3346031 RepID=UPI003629427C
MAIHRHDRHASRAAHTILAEKIWGALRDLGVARGRVLVTGPYAATLAGAPAPVRRADTGYRELVAAIPRVGWPHEGVRLAQLTPYDPAQHDVVIANIPLASLHARSVHGARRFQQVHQGLLARAVAHTFPGGVVVAVAARQVLDHPIDTIRRFLLTQRAQLLGAVRLPGTVLHPRLGNDQASPIDLLILRRPLPDEALEPAECLSSVPVNVPGGVEQINEWYALHHPDHVIGRPRAVADPDRGGTRYTVEHGEDQWDSALETTLAQVTGVARDRGLTAVSASWDPPDSRLAPQADWSAQATTWSATPRRPDAGPGPDNVPGL